MTKSLNDIIVQVGDLANAGENIISESVTKTVGVGKDFETLHLALRWVETITQASGLITLTLDDGIHLLGGEGERNETTYNYYQLDNVHLHVQSLSWNKSLCTIAQDPYDDLGAGGSLIGSTSSFLIFKHITFDSNAGGYAHIKTTACFKLRNSSLDIYKVDIRNFSYGISSVRFSNVAVDECLFYNCTRGTSIYNTTMYTYKFYAENCIVGLYVSTSSSSTCNLPDALFTNCVTDTNIPLNEVQYSGSYISTNVAPLIHRGDASIEETALATYTPNMASYKDFEYTLTQNTTIVNPTTETKNKTGNLVIKQDATGGWTCVFGTNFIFPSGAPSLNTSANAYNVFKYTVIASDKILMEFVADFI